jgi:serine/threonine protein kinase
MPDRGVLITPRLSPGTHFAGYRIEDVVGRGGMGVVYRAVDTTLDRTVALKVIAPLLSTDPVAHARFTREAKLAASLDHPNIVTVYGAGNCDGVLYLAMQFVPGTTLQAVVDESGALELPRTRWIVEHVAGALDAAHAHGLVHRDIKPANILLSGDPEREHVYLTDFGLTKRLGTLTPGPTRTGNWVGTPEYSSPEQIRGLAVGAGTDVYALGCVLYQLLTGESPYVREGPVATMWAHANDPPPAPCARRPELLPVFDFPHLSRDGEGSPRAVRDRRRARESARRRRASAAPP